jgi:SAM-dependent methyltransferase
MGCCACGGAVTQVLDLGLNYLSDFTDPGESRGERYPLRLVLCGDCTLLQLGDVTPRGLLYHGRYGFKSGINEAVIADLAAIAGYAAAWVPHAARWLDIGSNDGTLLAHVPAGVHRTGIDPLPQFAEEARTRADRIITAYFGPEWFRPGEFDVITSSAMFYDLQDPLEFAVQVASVLAPDGIWVIQQNYALDMLRNNVVDNICHEHLTYFSLRSLSALLARAGLEITDAGRSDAKGGCIRTAVSHIGAPRTVSGSVADGLAREQAHGLGSPQTWQRWGLEVRAELARTKELLHAVTRAGCRVYLYGASTRGATFLQMIGAGPDVLPFAADRNPAKAGKVMTSTGIPVISEEQMRADAPEYLLVAPWFFRDLFVQRERAYLHAGGKMIFPLPWFEVISG